MHVHRHNNMPIHRAHYATCRWDTCYTLKRGETGGGLEATNKRNTSLVTVSDNRCSVTVPLREHQLCSIMSQSLSRLSATQVYFVRSHFNPAGHCHATLQQIRWWCTSPLFYCTCATLKAATLQLSQQHTVSHSEAVIWGQKGVWAVNGLKILNIWRLVL